MSTGLDSCLAYLEKLPHANSGEGGHQATWKAVLACRRFGLGEGDTWEALQWWNRHKCSPPWSEKELRHKLESANRVNVSRPLGKGRHSTPNKAKPASATDLQLAMNKSRSRKSLRVASAASEPVEPPPSAPTVYAQRLAAARASALAELETHQADIAAAVRNRFSAAEEEVFWQWVDSQLGTGLAVVE